MPISNPVGIGSAATVASATTQTFNTTATIPSASKVWVKVGWFDSAATLSSVTGGGLTWTIDQQGKNGSVGFAIVSADAPAGLASGTTLQANYSISTADRFMGGMYSTGVQTGVGAAYGSVSQNEATGTWSSTTTAVTAGDVLVGGSHTSQASGSPTSTAGGGNTEIHDISTADGDSFTTVYQQGTGASIAASGTWSGSGWTDRDGAVAYKAAPAAGGYMPVQIANPFVGPMALRYKARAQMRPIPWGTASGTAWTQSFGDTITLSDAVANAIVLSKSDTITLSDVATSTVAWLRSMSDTITLADSVAKALGLNKSDTITLTDALAKLLGVNKSDTVTLTDAVAKTIGLGKSDTVTLTDAVAKNLAHLLADMITLSDVMTPHTGGTAWTLNFDDTITLADAFSRTLSDNGATPAVAAHARQIFLSRFGIY